MNAALILLAAGGSSRMGAAKQLLDWDGVPMVRHAAEMALATGCDPVVVVVGARASAVADALTGLPVDVAVNPDWAAGMGGSIRVGMEALSTADPDRVVVALADQPWVGADALRRLLDAHRTGGLPAAAARYAGTVGVPAVFSQPLFPALRSLSDSEGCRRLLRANPQSVTAVDCPEATTDIDTPQDYALRWAQTGR